MRANTGFSAGALYLGVITAAAGECVLGAGTALSARGAVLWGAAQALILAAVSALAAAALAGGGTRAGAARAVLAVWLCFELCGTILQAQVLCRQQFGSAAVLGAAPLLVWYGWRRAPRQINRAARVLWWFVLCAALVCALGLGGQLSWPRLFEVEAAGVPRAGVYAEYFAFPLLCEGSARDTKRAVWLPAGAFAVQAGFCVGMGLLFGEVPGSYKGAELLRALSVGAFSRLDAFLLLIWLTLALYRVCFLSAAVSRLLGGALKRRAGGELC